MCMFSNTEESSEQRTFWTFMQHDKICLFSLAVCFWFMNLKWDLTPWAALLSYSPWVNPQTRPLSACTFGMFSPCSHAFCSGSLVSSLLSKTWRWTSYFKWPLRVSKCVVCCNGLVDSKFTASLTRIKCLHKMNELSSEILWHKICQQEHLFLERFRSLNITINR